MDNSATKKNADVDNSSSTHTDDGATSNDLPNHCQENISSIRFVFFIIIFVFSSNGIFLSHTLHREQRLFSWNNKWENAFAWRHIRLIERIVYLFGNWKMKIDLVFLSHYFNRSCLFNEENPWNIFITINKRRLGTCFFSLRVFLLIDFDHQPFIIFSVWSIFWISARSMENKMYTILPNLLSNSDTVSTTTTTTAPVNTTSHSISFTSLPSLDNPITPTLETLQVDLSK